MGDKHKKRSLSRKKKRAFPVWLAKSWQEKHENPQDVELQEVAQSDDELELELSTSGEDIDVFDSSSDADDELSDEDEPSEASGTQSSNEIINLKCLEALLAAACVCANCKSGSLTVSEVQHVGLAPTAHLTCSDCGKVYEGPLADRKPPARFFSINRRCAVAMRSVGKGRQALKKVCAVMDLPPPVHKASYSKHSDALHTVAVDVGKKSMRKHAADLLRTRQEENLDKPSQVAVSTDGTWMRWGYSSQFGVQTVIAYDTQKVIDVEVMSKFCKKCEFWNQKLKQGEITQADFDDWKQKHVGDCETNTTVSAPTMETEAVKILWKRSEDTNKLQYTSYIGDGDSKGFTAVAELRPYGNDVQIEKEECIGHVWKQMGKNLRDLKQKLGSKKLIDGKPIGGRGRLTDKRIDSLQNYYGDAIKKHAGNEDEMARAIKASLYHSLSVDDDYCHDYCPPGKQSWCGWQKQKAGGPKYKHHDPLPKAVFEELVPVYLRLSQKELLRRCSRAATQNVNEAVNGMIWTMCSKESFCSVRTVETAVYLAVILYNEGHEKLSEVLTDLGCPVSASTTQALRKLDEEKSYHRRRKSSDMEKSTRRTRRAQRKGFRDQAQEKEGVTYSAGGFWVPKVSDFLASRHSLVQFILAMLCPMAVNHISIRIYIKFARCSISSFFCI